MNRTLSIINSLAIIALLALMFYMYNDLKTAPTGDLAQQTAQTQMQPAQNSDELLDQQLFISATQGGAGQEACDQISDEALKNDCSQVVAAGAITSEALEKMDTSLCSDIELERYETACVTAIEKEEMREQEALLAAQQREEMMAEVNRISSEAKEKDDESLCAQIADENHKNSCIFNIVANRAYETGDTALCDSLPLEDMVATCQAVVLENK